MLFFWQVLRYFQMAAPSTKMSSLDATGETSHTANTVPAKRYVLTNYFVIPISEWMKTSVWFSHKNGFCISRQRSLHGQGLINNYFKRPGGKEYQQTEQFVCEKCTSHFISKKMFDKHTLECNNFFCNVCKKTFKSQKTFDKHLHKNCPPKKFPCGNCRKTFSRKTDCVLHTKKCIPATPYICEHCKKCFMTKMWLELHTNQKHTQWKEKEKCACLSIDTSSFFNRIFCNFMVSCT